MNFFVRASTNFLQILSVLTSPLYQSIYTLHSSEICPKDLNFLSNYETTLYPTAAARFEIFDNTLALHTWGVTWQCGSV